MCRTKRARASGSLSKLAPFISGKAPENDSGVNATPYHVEYCRVSADTAEEEPEREEAVATG